MSKSIDKKLTIKYLTNVNFIFVDIKANDTIMCGQSFVSKIFKILSILTMSTEQSIKVLVNIDVNFGQTNQLFVPFKQRDKISKINNYNLEMLFIFRLISTEVSQ